MPAAQPVTHSVQNPSSSAVDPTERELAWIKVVAERIRGLRFGTVHIKVHEAQVVLIESTEQTRFDLSQKSRF